MQRLRARADLSYMSRVDAQPDERRHSRLLEEAQAIAHVGSWEWDFASDTLSWTDEHYRIFGRHPSTFTPTMESARACIHEDDVARVAASMLGTISVGQPYSLVTRIRRPDGEIRWIEAIGVPSIVEGVVVSLLGTSLDVTVRELDHARLRDSEMRLAEAQRLALLGNWSFDVHSRVLTCSDELFAVIGVDPDSGVASFDRFLFLVDPDDRERAKAFLGRVRNDFTEVSEELRIITPAGDHLWLAMRAAPVLDAAGQVTAMWGTLQDITERKASEEQLVHLALHDMLTGLPNRALFNERLAHALSRRDTSVVVMLLDLDGLKAINDGLGHSAGDALLIAVAERLSAAVRPSDTVARFGGDEFTILLEDTGEADAKVAAGRLLKALAMPLAVEARSVVGQASIGVALGHCGSRSADQLLQEADAAMYVAKRRGGGRFELFDGKLHASVVERMALECDLRAIELGAEMTLSYQPLVDLRDGHLTGFEALLRWNHPERGPISPEDFIPIAEQTGAIVPIGRWVLEEACRQCRRWQEEYPTGVALAMNVNVSTRQLSDPDIVRDVERALDASGLDPGLLTLEITETMSVGDEDEVGETLHQLKDLGVRISVDDFGTGYSSLCHLDQFPVDELKIDRSFVARLSEGAQDSGVALAIIRLARSLHLDVVAEGIESEDQLMQLRDAQCTRGQGYYFWRPLDVASVDALLEGLRQSAAPREFVRT
jgi:diguanylate cyclase (GGDEF)-like protein/PAS domain S-box-containing protein